MARALGYVDAKGKAISGALRAGSSIGIILDGIGGMFQRDASVESGVVMQRKAIAAIALKAGCPIVPVYGFGHTSLWTAVTDPFGILEKISIALNVSVCPFYGRWGWYAATTPNHRDVRIASPWPLLPPNSIVFRSICVLAGRSVPHVANRCL